MRLNDGSPTICSVLRGIRLQVQISMPDRGVDLKEKTLRNIDSAIRMAKKMSGKLEFYKQKENKQ